MKKQLNEFTLLTDEIKQGLLVACGLLATGLGGFYGPVVLGVLAWY